MRFVPIEAFPDLHRQWHIKFGHAIHQAGQLGLYQYTLGLRHFQHQFIVHLHDEPR